MAWCASTRGSHWRLWPRPQADLPIPWVDVVLRCTAKMLALLGARQKDLVRVESSARDWYANLLWLDGRKCLLLAHAGTLLSVFVPDIRKADLAPIGPAVVALIHGELEAESLSLDRLGVLDSSSVALAKTESRMVLGYMNRWHGSANTRSRRLAAWPAAMRES